MRNRSLLEFNHDYAGRIEENPKVFIEELLYYLRSGQIDRRLERFGIELVQKRHHTERKEAAMNIWHNNLEDGQCVELCCDDRLIGYAIFFSGGWDCYVLAPFGNLRKVATNAPDKDQAILMVKREAMG